MAQIACTSFGFGVLMEPFQLMMEAGDFLPEHIKPWTTWMQVVLFLLPLAFIKHVPPRILILTQIMNTMVAYLVFVWEGEQVTRLFGLGHFLWIWPAVYLYRDMRNAELARLYRGFAATAVLTISISLVFDVRDNVLWVFGDRGSVLADVPVNHALYRGGRPEVPPGG